MPSVAVSQRTPSGPDAVFAAATDFSARRATYWRDVHLEHFEVHALGPDHADVTEGNLWPVLGVVWERLHYDWSSGDRLVGTVVDSNIFRPGSTWSLRVTPHGTGCRVDIAATRLLRGRGRLLWPFFPTGLAKRDVADYLDKFLAVVERRQ